MTSIINIFKFVKAHNITYQFNKTFKTTMKKTLSIFLLIISFNAAAEWTLVTTSEDNKEKYYVELDTKRVDGDIIKIWTYVNYLKPKKMDSYSISGQNEYDCKNEMERTLYLNQYKKLNLKGAVVASGDGDSKWFPIPPPPTMGRTMFNYVCNIK